MKKFILGAGLLMCTLIFVFEASAQQTTVVACPTNPFPTTCPQTAWATPYIVNESRTTTITTLQPDTRYFMVLEALPPVAPCSAVVIITNIDGSTSWDGTPYNGTFGGRDVASSDFPGRPYKVYLPFRTPTLASGDFVTQLYVKYRMECSSDTGTRTKSSQKQALIP